jgi:hypothetical protein
MRRFPNKLSVVLAGVVAVWCPLAQAQEESLPVVDLEFQGGTIAQYVQTLCREVVHANVVVTTPEVGEIPLPPVRLSSVDIASALRLLAGRYELAERTLIQVDVQQIGHWSGDESPVFKVAGQIQRRGKPAVETAVWTVADLLAEDMKPQDVLTAVETVLELFADDRSPAQVRFHEATGLLIARGDPRQVEAVDEVIDELREGVDRGRAAAEREAALMDQDAGRQMGQLERVLQTRELELEQLKVRAAAAGEECQRLQAEKQRLLDELRQKEALVEKLRAQGT